MKDRNDTALEALLRVFIRTGRAVGSATVAKEMGTRLSSATIRNVMSSLEKMGFLTHLHTSGGRIPTDSGIRYYLDRLLTLEPLTNDLSKRIKNEYEGTSYNLPDILRQTSDVLSNLSQHTGAVVAPQVDNVLLKYVEFIPLSQKKVMGIFVSTNGTARNRVIKLDEELTYPDLEKINNYCRRAFYGLTFREAKNRVGQELEKAKKEYDRLICKALYLSQNMFLNLTKSQLFIAGEPQSTFIEDQKAPDMVGNLKEAIKEKSILVKILNTAIKTKGVRVFIGKESGYRATSDCSIVTTSYGKGGKVLGSLGVIGPTYMDYSRVVPIVDCTARLISNYLEEGEFV